MKTVKITKETHPALWQILRMDKEDWRVDLFGGRTGCADCAFAVNQQDVNEADLDEGYYDCIKLGYKHIWGEGPRCKGEDWNKWAREELGLAAASNEKEKTLEERILKIPEEYIGIGTCVKCGGVVIAPKDETSSTLFVHCLQCKAKFRCVVYATHGPVCNME